MPNPAPGPDDGYIDADYAAGDFGAAISGDAPTPGLAATARARLLDLAEDGKSELVRNIDSLVGFANEIAARVDSIGGGSSIAAPVAELAYRAAGMIGDFQGQLRDKPVEDLLNDGRRLVREQPAIAAGIAFLAGFLVSRLVKARR